MSNSIFLSSGELREHLKGIVRFNEQPEKDRSSIERVIEKIVKASSEVGLGNIDDKTTTNASKIDIRRIFLNEDGRFDGFLIDNVTGLMFADLGSKHLFVKMQLTTLYVLSQGLILSDQVKGFYSVRKSNLYEISDIYTDLCLGIYSSTAMGDRKIICSEYYPFSDLNQDRLATAHSLSVSSVSPQDALASLERYIAKIK